MTKLELKSEKNKKINEILESDTQTKLALLKNQFEISIMLINEILEDEVREYSGERYKRDKPKGGRYSRWGYNPGSVWIGEEKVGIQVPRIYDNKERRNKALENYEQLKDIEPDENRLMKAILYGLSTNDYKSIVEQFIDSRGLSRSKVSQRFIEESSKRLEEFSNRDLSVENYISIFIDGKYFHKEQIVIALGITEDGRKIPLGFIQTTKENSTSIKQLLSNLIDRGLKYEDGLLFVIDGSKGIRKAVEDTFGKYSVIQRCQWHKRENIISYLNDKDKEIYKKKLNKAYNAETYEDALKELMQIHNELLKTNRNAANSLMEGLEETLTLHRLGINEEFKKSFSTTNVIENLNSQLVKYTRKVKNWKNSDQRQRWIASGLLEIEKRMKRVNNFNNLHILKEKLIMDVKLKLN